MHHYQIGKLQGASTCERPNCRVAKRGFEVAGYQSREGPSCRSGTSRHARGRKRADELLLERRPTCRGAEVGPSMCGAAPEPEEVRGRWRRATSRGGARVQEAEARLGSDAGVQEEVVDARPSEVKEAALGEGGEQGAAPAASGDEEERGARPWGWRACCHGAWHRVELESEQGHEGSVRAMGWG
jgi:hypothetical protein